MQETLFILKNAGLFRTEAGDVYQVWHMQMTGGPNNC